MKTNPKVTIITTVYNGASHLETCLNSLTHQIYQNLEIILINDGSTDDSLQILKSYAKNDSRIKVIDQKNQGLSSARNTGLQKATGDYVTFVDADDEITPDMISKLVDILKTTDADLAICSFKEIYSTGQIVGFSRQYSSQTFNTKDALRAMLKEQGFMLSATMKLYPLAFFKQIKFPIGKLHEDVGTTYKLIMKAQKIAFIPDELYLYHHYGTSITQNSFNNRKFDLIELTDTMCDEIDQKFPSLLNVTKERRMRARLSLLRQLPARHPRKKELTNYLKNHKAYITKNPEASLNDQIALRIALKSPKLLKLAYRISKH